MRKATCFCTFNHIITAEKAFKMNWNFVACHLGLFGEIALNTVVGQKEWGDGLPPSWHVSDGNLMLTATKLASRFFFKNFLSDYLQKFSLIAGIWVWKPFLLLKNSIQPVAAADLLIVPLVMCMPLRWMWPSFQSFNRCLHKGHLSFPYLL